MKRTIVLTLVLLLIVTGCGGGKAGERVDDLQKKNEDLTRRVKALEEDLLEANKKLIQHQQALQAMHERLRDMENAVSKIQIVR